MTTRSSQFGTYFRDHLTEQLDPLVEQVTPIAHDGLLRDQAADDQERKERLSLSLIHI